MNRGVARRRLMVAAVLATAVAAAGAMPAAAAVVLGESGQYGPYVVADQITEPRMPGARCGYGPEINNVAFFKWMRFRKPDVYARDTGPGTQQQKVVLRYEIEREVGPGWVTVAKSKQRATAYETMPAGFVAQKLYYNGADGDVLRGVLHIKWFRNGVVEGWVRIRLEHYSVKWTVGEADYTFTDACPGSAD